MKSSILFLFGVFLRYGRSCPDVCECTAEGRVRCSGNFTNVPSFMPLQTYYMELKKTRIQNLTERSLLNLPLVLRLSITQNPLQVIDPEAFYPVPQLLSLKLSFNKISNLSSQVFSNLASLEQLYIDNNNLDSLKPELFDTLTNLTQLDASRNYLTHLDRNIFEKLTKLCFLNLGKNFLSKLPDGVFSSLTNLQHLLVYENQLEILSSETFKSLTKLRVLKLFKNRISCIPPQLFWPLSNLEILSISSNKLHYFPEETFYSLPHITTLNLFKNPLVFLPDQLIGHMPKLKEFYLYSTNLITVPNNLFYNMSGLEILSLNYNPKLHHLPKDIFCCLPKLTRLSLQTNDLRFLDPDLFVNLSNLSTLIIHSNKLHQLSNNIFHSLTKLSEVQLHGNHLKNFPSSVLSSAVALRNVSLKDNPWNCNCRILDLAEWISHHRTLVHDYEHVSCYTPSYLLEKTVGSMNSRLLQCEVNENPPIKISSTISNTSASVQTSSHGFQVEGDQLTDIATISIWKTTSATPRISPSMDLVPQSTTEDSLSYSPSYTFYDTVILAAEPDIVHNSHLNGLVFLWTLPTSGTYSTFLISLQILLITMGAALIVAGVCIFQYVRSFTEKFNHV
ncbi:platelet glycoprotein V-like isoform X1 [Brienomyrus brachyistius]|uniref:platelet glycoprotein V-like isoform X1 n=1 Tax=Brienomyrus brachyistius TaxID=42636 RepID=UPI0020B4279E|nr:platelet glycoprotein V-like isoform X1 [Brienomyrus brachyistius]